VLPECGRGTTTRMLAQWLPGARVAAVDLSGWRCWQRWPRSWVVVA